jgi:DNA-binding transcriptional LysR family regulator
MEEQALALERKISGQYIRVSGTVHISALDACINEFILQSLPALHERFPEQRLVLSTEIEVADLGRRKPDIAIRYLRPREPNLVVRRLADVTSALYASKEYVRKHGILKKLNALQGHQFIGFAPEYSFASEEQWIQNQAFAVNVVVRITSQLALREAIREGIGIGIGIGILESYLGDRDPELVRIWRRPILKDNWWLVVHKDMRHAARIRAVMDFLVEQTTVQSDLLLGQAGTGN